MSAFRSAPEPLRPEHARFALRLWRDLPDSAAGGTGLVWSPYSLAAALGLLASGARGTTRAELTALLATDDLDAMLAAVDDAGRARGAEPETATATSLWVRPDLPIEDTFERRLRARPDSAVHAADFATDPAGARDAVNADVAKTTRGLITELLSPDHVTRRTQAILVNALWTRLAWAVPFDRDATRLTTFHAPTGRRTVPTMHWTGSLPYAEHSDWRMVTLTGGHELFLDVLLPPTGAPPAPPEPETLRRLYRSLASGTQVELALPRFALETRLPLAEVLTAAGAGTVFTDGADLSGISSRPLKVDQVVHQALLRVDEHGAEGAAATAVVMRVASAFTGRPVRFTVDRPFHAVLRRGGVALFLGAVTDPREAGAHGSS